MNGTTKYVKLILISSLEWDYNLELLMHQVVKLVVRVVKNLWHYVKLVKIQLFILIHQILQVILNYVI